jgi:hypothetical protein
MDFKSSSCILCGTNLSSLSELDRVLHINDCLDSKIDPALEELKELSDTDSEPESTEISSILDSNLQEMPNYDAMSSEAIKKEMDNYGMKKNLGLEASREILKQTWLYLYRGVFPPLLEKYLN